jgi:hypothetical protein
MRGYRCSILFHAIIAIGAHVVGWPVLTQFIDGLDIPAGNRL